MTTDLQLLKCFKIVRFQPDDIILLDNHTKKVYQYYQISTDVPLHLHISLPNLLRPKLLGKSAIYQKPYKDLETQIKNKKMAYIPLPFSQQQIIGTLCPIMGVVIQLHKLGVIHGAVQKCNIIYDQSGEIKLRDWLLQPSKQQINKDFDYRALGMIFMECCTLKSIFAIKAVSFQESLSTCYSKYTKYFLLSIIILINNYQHYYSDVYEFFKNGTVFPLSEQLNKYYDRIRQFFNLANAKLQIGQISPMKKFLITSNKRTIKQQQANINQNTMKKNILLKFDRNKQQNETKLKAQSNENIMNPEQSKIGEDIKKKHIEKISKIIERSNAFVNQLMCKRTNDYKKIIKSNISFNDIQNKKSKDSKQLSSPTKRLKFSKKK